eukprot:s133_g36.t1
MAHVTRGPDAASAGFKIFNQIDWFGDDAAPFKAGPGLCRWPFDWRPRRAGGCPGRHEAGRVATRCLARRRDRAVTEVHCVRERPVGAARDTYRDWHLSLHVRAIDVMLPEVACRLSQRHGVLAVLLCVHRLLTR